MKHDDSIALLEFALGESPGGLLEHYGGGGGGVVNDGDLVDVVGIDEVLDDGPGMENALFELVEVETVRLGQVRELPPALGLDYGVRARPETAVVDSGDIRVVMGELGSDFGGCDEGELGLFGSVGLGIAVEGVGVVVVVVGGGSHWRIRVSKEEHEIERDECCVCFHFSVRLV